MRGERSKEGRVIRKIFLSRVETTRARNISLEFVHTATMSRSTAHAKSREGESLILSRCSPTTNKIRSESKAAREENEMNHFLPLFYQIFL